jgi:hypothetical protein
LTLLAPNNVYTDAQWDEASAQQPLMIPGSQAQTQTGLHCLGHFFASWCINRRIDGGLELPLEMVQARLGHATLAMTADVSQFQELSRQIYCRDPTCCFPPLLTVHEGGEILLVETPRTLRTVAALPASACSDAACTAYTPNSDMALCVCTSSVPGRASER